jgi:hypothetical protein
VFVNPKLLVSDYWHCYSVVMLFQFWVRCSCLMLALFLTLDLQARPVTYTGSAVMSGALNGINFTGAAVTFSVTGDTINIFKESGFNNTYKLLTNPITFDIAGIGSGAITGPTPFGVISTDISPLSSGKPVAGFFSGYTTFISNPNYLLGTALDSVYNLEILPPPLYAPVSFEGEAFSSTFTFDTPVGSLFLDGSSLSGTSTFIAAEPVPEPSTYVLLFFGLATAFVFTRRQKTN